MNREYYNMLYRQATPNNIDPTSPEVNEQKPKTAPDFYIDDNLFMNLGHKAEFHMSFPDSLTDRDKVFSGVISEATSDHIVVFNEDYNEWYLLPLLYLNYVLSKEKPVIL